MIDISEDQIQLIKGIYDSQSKVGNAVNTVAFFMALRRSPHVRKILTAIARDPEGHSRLPKETFQQVFDRMEKDMQVKTIDWSTVIEYFTKLGRPLSKDEIQRLVDADKRMKEESEEVKRREEEAERRRMARLMDDVREDGDQDFNDKLGGAGKSRKRATFHGDSDEDGDSDDLRDDDRVFRDFDEEDFDSDEEDDLEREHGGSRFNRQMSAGGLGNGNLADKRITADDYVHQLRVQSQRKGRYGVTVPEPFSFEMRDQANSKANIRETKVNEMVMEKKIEESNMLKH
jgi:hypothetical protein